MRLLGRRHEPHTHDFTQLGVDHDFVYFSHRCGTVLTGACSTYRPVRPGDYFLLARGEREQTRYRVRMCEWHVDPVTLNYVVLDYAPRA